MNEKGVAVVVIISMIFVLIGIIMDMAKSKD